MHSCQTARKFQGVTAREQIRHVFVMAESDGELAGLNISSSYEGSCQNTCKIKRFSDIFLCFHCNDVILQGQLLK